jgi:hypothetical protein
MGLRTANHRQTQQGRLGEPRSYAGYEVRDPQGQRIGTVEEVLADLNDEPRYVRVKMGLFGLRSALIPVQLVAHPEVTRTRRPGAASYPLTEHDDKARRRKTR